MRHGPFLTIVMLCACASLDVRVEHDETARLPRFRTFAFSPGTPAPLRDLLERELAARGLRPDRKKPDVFVGAEVGEVEREEVSPFAARPGFNRSPGGTSPIRTVRRPVLTVTMADAASGAVVFRGRAPVLDPEAGTAAAVRALAAEIPAAR